LFTFLDTDSQAQPKKAQAKDNSEDEHTIHLDAADDAPNNAVDNSKF